MAAEIPSSYAENDGRRQAPLINILTLALPTYDEKLGWGIYGITAWMEALQRQVLSAAFVVFPEDVYQSAALLNHSVKLLDSDWMNTLYHGPVIFSHDRNKYIQLYQTIYRFDFLKNWFIGGNPRTTFSLNSAYSFNWHHLNETVPEIPKHFDYHGIHAGVGFSYLSPTRLYPVLPRREIAFGLGTFQSLADKYRFNVSEINLRLASNIWWDEVGLTSNLSYVHGSGTLPPFKNIGIDRYYEWNIPRDYKFTRTLRGIREDISGKNLFWCSSDLLYFIDENTGYDILFLPVDNLAASLFIDYARIKDIRLTEITSYGAELSFGGGMSRLAMGYAVGRLSDRDRDRTIYGRLTLYLTAQ